MREANGELMSERREARRRQAAAAEGGGGGGRRRRHTPLLRTYCAGRYLLQPAEPILLGAEQQGVSDVHSAPALQAVPKLGAAALALLPHIVQLLRVVVIMVDSAQFGLGGQHAWAVPSIWALIDVLVVI